MNDLKPLYDDHQVEVPRRVWNQIESKLNERKQHQNFIKLRTFTAIAACFIIACIFSYIKLGFASHNPQLFSSSETYKSMIFEDLESKNAPIYDYNQVKDLKMAILKSQPSFGNRNR